MGIFYNYLYTGDLVKSLIYLLLKLPLLREFLGKFYFLDYLYRKSYMKYYAVRVGRIIGIYFLWKDCEAQTKGFPGSEFKAFTSIMDAVEYIGFERSLYGK